MTEELKRKCKICVITTLGQDEYIDCLEEQYEELEKENEQLKEMSRSLREKLFILLSEYEIGKYDSNIHQFYKDVYDIHNELMEGIND